MCCWIFRVLVGYGCNMAGLRSRFHNVFGTTDGITNDETALETDTKIAHGKNKLEIALPAKVV